MKKSLICVLCVVLACVFVVGCTPDGNNSNGNNNQNNEPQYTLSLDKTSISVSGDQEIVLTATAGAESYVWLAEDPYIVQIIPNGNTCKVKSRGDGVTNVTCSANGWKVFCNVTSRLNNWDRVSSMAYYCSVGEKDNYHTATTFSKNNDTGVISRMQFAENSLVIADIILTPKVTMEGGSLNSITIHLSFNTSSSTPIVKQILNSSQIKVTYWYSVGGTYVGSDSYNLSSLDYTITNDRVVSVTNGTMSDLSHYNSLPASERLAIINNTLSLLSEGMTDFIKGANEKCYIDICA